MAEHAFRDIGPVVLVGAGKMGLALARGWLAAGLAADRLVLVDPKAPEVAQAFAQERGVRLLDSPAGVLVHVLVLAVKPQVMSAVLAEIQPSVGRHTLVISIAAGISIAGIAGGLGTERIIRTMPNTPAQVGRGVTGAVAGPGLIDGDVEVAETLLSAAGKLVWFSEEAKLDAVTAVSGSGPAYVFHLVEALAAAGEKQGLEPKQAMLLARETVIGAAALMDADPLPASRLRENVTSPNGTTAAALEILMGDDGLTSLMERAVTRARERSEELGRG